MTTTTQSNAATFLGVERSLTGRRWIGLAPDQDRAAARIAQATSLPPTVASVLAQRGVEPEDTAAFLAPTLRELMPDPRDLKDMEAAAQRLAQATQAQERIAVFADYDVDGAASGALLVNWLAAFGITATAYVPDRVIEGYGPNNAAMEALGRAHDLIICVDCGTLSHEPIAAARTAGADVIVLDHHLGGETLPECTAVVNPNRQDETSPLTYLCAAGVVFMLLVEVNRTLRDKGQNVPDLLSMLDLVALATVADVAPLKGLNRAFVRQGLKVMARRAHLGLAHLADVASVTSAPNAYALGYLMGPRINAGGRIGKADLGLRLLTTGDPHEARAMADQLNILNKERRDIEIKVLAEARAQVEARGFDGPLVWAASEGWHPGVVGIVASRLKEAFNRPALVMGFDGEDGKGSGRSVSPIDLGASIATLAREELIERGGGHKMAAGVSLTPAQLEPAMERLSALLERQGANLLGPRDLLVSGIVTPPGASLELGAAIEEAGPFGAGAPAPRLAIAAAQIGFAKRAGEKHLSLRLKSQTGSALDVIAFNAFEGPLGPALEAHDGQPFHLAGQLTVDEWGGRRRPKLRLEDAAPAG